jgi:hypothetical protein
VCRGDDAPEEHRGRLASRSGRAVRGRAPACLWWRGRMRRVGDFGAAFLDGEAAGVASDALPAHVVEPVAGHFTQHAVHGLCSVCKSVTIAA